MTADAVRPRVPPSGPFLPPTPPPIGGGLTALVQVLTPLESTPLPGDGTSTPAFTLLHTSATGHRIIWCSFTGSTDWDGAPKPGAGIFATLLGSNFVPIVGGWEQTIMVETGPFAQLTSLVLNTGTEPAIPNPGTGTYGPLSAEPTTSFNLQTQNVAEWSMADGGVVTYLGNDPINVLVTVTATVEYGGAVPDQFAIAPSKSNDLNGAAIFGDPALAAGAKWTRVDTAIDGPDHIVTASRVVTLNNGDTLQAVYAVAVTAADSTLEAYSMTIQALSEVTYDGTTFSGSFLGVAPAAVGVAEEVDVIFQFQSPGSSAADQWIWAGTCVVADYTPA